MTKAFDLRAAYENEGFSRRSFAKHLDVHEHTIRRLEQRRGVHPANAKKVADHFGLRVTDLMPEEVAA